MMQISTIQKHILHIERCTIIIRENEIDPYGVVNNAEYYNYFEHGRLMWLKSIGITVDSFLRLFYLVSANVKYINSLRFSDEVELVTKIKCVDETTVEFVQMLSSKTSGDIVAKSTAVYRYAES